MRVIIAVICLGLALVVGCSPKDEVVAYDIVDESSRGEQQPESPRSIWLTPPKVSIANFNRGATVDGYAMQLADEVHEIGLFDIAYTKPETRAGILGSWWAQHWITTSSDNLVVERDIPGKVYITLFMPPNAEIPWITPDSSVSADWEDPTLSHDGNTISGSFSLGNKPIVQNLLRPLITNRVYIHAGSKDEILHVDVRVRGRSYTRPYSGQVIEVPEAWQLVHQGPLNGGRWYRLNCSWMMLDSIQIQFLGAGSNVLNEVRVLPMVWEFRLKATNRGLEQLNGNSVLLALDQRWIVEMHEDYTQ